MNLLTEIMDLLDLVGSRECLHELADTTCPDTLLIPEDWCEPCKARSLFTRLAEAKKRVAPQGHAMRARTPLDQALDAALPGTWVAVNAEGDVRRVVPKGPLGQYTLAMPLPGVQPELPL